MASLSSTSPTHRVQLPRQLLRNTAAKLLQFRRPPLISKSSFPLAITVICISDTHNLRPSLPPGDILIHAGDLTEWGTFDEVQAQLRWISSQPHEHKLIIAGNHDLLFDTDFLERHPKYRDPQGRTRRDLDFGSVTYLQDEWITLHFAAHERSLTVYGSPWTPQYGTSAFQYPRAKDIWYKKVLKSTDILITHGPPARFRDIKPGAGCRYLRDEVGRVKPKLMVFGHIHVARGEQIVAFDTAQAFHDDIMDGARGWEAIPVLLLAVAWSRLRQIVGHPVEPTRMIDAAVVDGMDKEVALEAFVVDL